MKQTAVEWLELQLIKRGIYIGEELYNQAKAMEKEELKDFYFGGCSEMYATEKGFENYYYETYKQKQI